MIIRHEENIDLSDTIITIIWVTGKDKHGITRDLAGKVIYHHAEYDKKITLRDIHDKYPTVRIVISEDPLKGKVYVYGNHGDLWEEVGQTQGYA